LTRDALMGTPVPARRMSARWLPVVLALIAFLAPPALAETYASSQHYYSVTVPSTWIRESFPGADVVWIGPTYQSSPANINVVVAMDPTAQNTASWILSVAQAGHAQVFSQFSGTSVQTPRSFTSGSGRPAADYVIDYDYLGNPLRVRQVLFASDVRDRGYVLTFTAHRDHFPNLLGVWQGVVDSFTVDEPSGVSTLLWVSVGAVAVTATAGAIAAVALNRQKKALASLRPPEVPWGPQGFPPPGAPPAPPSAPMSPPTPPQSPPSPPSV